MIVPTDKQSIAYCASIGLRLVHCVDTSPDGKNCWVVIQGNGPDVEEYYSLLALWKHLMHFAAYALAEHQKFKAFMELYDQSTPSRRQELEGMIDRVYADGYRSDAQLERDLDLPRSISVDHLPGNWKEQMADLFKSNSGLTDQTMMQQVSEELDRRKKAALLSS